MDTDKNTAQSSEKYFAYSEQTASLQNKTTYEGYSIALDHQYANAVTSIEIPAEYNGLPVVQIGFSVTGFQIYDPKYLYEMDFGFHSKSLKSVTIPESVRVICCKAFLSGGYISSLEEAIFEQPSGWKYYTADYVYMGKVPEATLADPKAAAKFLKQGYRLERVG